MGPRKSSGGAATLTVHIAESAMYARIRGVQTRVIPGCLLLDAPPRAAGSTDQPLEEPLTDVPKICPSVPLVIRLHVKLSTTSFLDGVRGW